MNNTEYENLYNDWCHSCIGQLHKSHWTPPHRQSFTREVAAIHLVSPSRLQVAHYCTSRSVFAGSFPSIAGLMWLTASHWWAVAHPTSANKVKEASRLGLKGVGTLMGIYIPQSHYKFHPDQREILPLQYKKPQNSPRVILQYWHSTCMLRAVLLVIYQYAVVSM